MENQIIFMQEPDTSLIQIDIKIIIYTELIKLFQHTQTEKKQSRHFWCFQLNLSDSKYKSLSKKKKKTQISYN